MTSWLRGPALDDRADLWESLDAALAAYSPRIPAVVDPASGTSLSSAELHRRVELAAGSLVGAGAQPGDCVIIDLGHSVDELVQVLSCVRQGFAYVGWAAGAPAHGSVVQDAAPAVVVTDRPADWQHLRTISPQGHGAPVAVPPPGSAEVCYVSYTSGSTGRPKGVEAPRAGVDRLMRGADYCLLGSGDRILRFAPLAFDASTFEIFVALWRQATIVIGPSGPLDIDALAEFVVDERIDVCWLTSGLFSSLVDYRPEAFAKLRQVLTGGDRVSAASVTTLLNRFPELSVVNGYGPTEATTFASVRAISLADLPLDSVPIGRPIGDTDVGISSDGEILIAGPGVALGYRNNPELTAEYFSDVDRRRVYRTGDLGAIVDGELHFCGRRDRQLKIRGFRVEPGAVDELLRRHQVVTESWTFGLRVASGTEVVCAFVSAPGSSYSAAMLRRHLIDAGLPDHAIPHRFLKVSTIPLTPNGKVDEAALASKTRRLRGEAPVSDAKPTRRGSSVTEAVRHAWTVALGAGDFDDHSGFFDSGGDSLRLAKVHAMLHDMFADIDIKLVDLLQHSSVAQQAAALQAKLEATGRPTV